MSESSDNRAGSSNRSNRGRGRGNNPGGSHRGGYTTDRAPHRRPFQARDPKPDTISDRPPAPAHPSTSSSIAKNDPLAIDSFVPPSADLTEEPNDEFIYPGAEALPGMTQVLYDEYTFRDDNFVKNVSPSAFGYYCGVIAWARMLKIQEINKHDLLTDEREFIADVFTSNYVIPRSLAMYLSGFGNTTIPSSIETKFALKPYVYDQGYFGPIRQNLHLYASYPCLGVFKQRIVQDLSNAPGAWDLPVGMAFADHAITTNCLGYAPAVNPSPSQRALFARSGIDANHFPSNNDTLPFNPSLVGKVSNALLAIASLETLPLPAGVNGSQAQLITMTTSNPRPTMIDSTFTMASNQHCHSAIAYLSGAFIYRIEKILHTTQAQAGIYMPVVWPAPPADARATLNTLQTGWNTVLNNVSNFGSVKFKPRKRLEEVASVDITKKSLA